MENLAHTLLGLSMAKAGLERVTPFGTTALVVASNLPDVDVLVRIGGDTSSYLEYHRGLTHSFVGLAVLAVLLAFVLTLVDRRFRLRGDHRRRPVRPMRLFWLALLGGLGHTFMDFTNNYGVRPLEPFTNRWFYGDFIFVVDPWIWLILGSTLVWLTASSAGRILFWTVLGCILALVMGLALRDTTAGMGPLPPTARLVFFIGFAAVAAGALMRFGRGGERLARYSLIVLGLYYGAMWMAHQSALRHAAEPPPSEGGYRVGVWPTPADPTLWEAAAAADGESFSRTIRLPSAAGEWRPQAGLESRFIEALRCCRTGREFLGFSRFYSASVSQNGEGYSVVLRDMRFNLQLRAELDNDLNVLSSSSRWF